MTDIVILALISLILCVKLFFLFGQRRDIHQRPFAGYGGSCPAAVNTMKNVELDLTKIKEPFARIKALDSSFELKDFLKGVQDFYKQTLIAYAKGDTHSLSEWLNIDMMRHFAYAITTREDAGLHCQIDVLGVKDSILEEAACDDKGMATLKVLIKAEIIKYITKDNHKVIEGSKTKVENRDDLWTFSKNLRHTGQSWKLTDVTKLA